MTNWLERARLQLALIEKAATAETAKTIETTVSAVLAVDEASSIRVLRTSFGSFDSTLASESDKNASGLASAGRAHLIVAAEYLSIEEAFDAPLVGAAHHVAGGDQAEFQPTGSGRAATPAESRELRTLIDVLFGPSTEAVRDALHERALAYPGEALDHYRAIAQKKGCDLKQIQRWDNRRTCLECKNLTPNGKCLAAWNGQLRGVIRDFTPIKDIQHRCEGYIPKFQEPD